MGRRTRARRKKLTEVTISNKKFMAITITLFIVIALFLLILIKINKDNIEKVAEDKKTASQHIEEIYKANEKNLQDLKNYKTGQIIRISAVGDLLCGDNLQKYSEDFSYIFEDVSEYISGADIALATYETTKTGEFSNAIKNVGIDCVSIANNRILDDGLKGLTNTKKQLEKIGLKTVGFSDSKPENRVSIIEKKGVKIAVLAYCYNTEKKGVNVFSEDLAKEDLEYASKNAAAVVVLMHWENINSTEVTNLQKQQTSFLVENGADVIIGTHPSTIQRMEVVENSKGEKCLIAYSLGDFTTEVDNENAKLNLILNIQIYVDENGKNTLYNVDYTPVYMLNKGTKIENNRYKILDTKNEIEKYENNKSEIDKSCYDRLLKSLDRLKSILNV